MKFWLFSVFANISAIGKYNENEIIPLTKQIKVTLL